MNEKRSRTKEMEETIRALLRYTGHRVGCKIGKPVYDPKKRNKQIGTEGCTCGYYDVLRVAKKLTTGKAREESE